MANFLFLILLFSVGQVHSLRLENICYSDIFHYNGLFVNAIHRYEQVVYLPEIGYFLVPEADDFHFLLDHSGDSTPDQSLRNAILQVKSDYNAKMQEIYSEAYVNGPNFEIAIRSETEFFGQIAERVLQVRQQMQQLRRSVDWFDKKTLPFKKGQQLVDYLLPFLDGRLQPHRPIGYTGLQPNKEKQFAALESYLLKRLDPQANQTFALYDDYMTDIYEMRIVSRPRLELSQYPRTFFDPNSHGRLRYEIALPFYTQAYDRSATCVDAGKLPKFFAKRSNMKFFN